MGINRLISMKRWIVWALLAGLCNSATAQDMDNGLSKRQRSIVPVAAFAAKGDLENLDAALNEALDAGLTVSEAKEVLVHLYAYTGFPRSLNGLNTLMTVLDKRTAQGITDEQGREADPLPAGTSSYALGAEVQTRLSGAPVTGGAMDFAPAIDYCLKAHLFGDLFGRNNLKESDRELATLSALSALDGTDGQLKAHLRYARNAGLSEAQLLDLIDVLKEKVGRMEAYRADKVIGTACERKFTMGQPIEDVFPRGRVSTADYFTGTVWNQRLVSGDSLSHCQTSNVTFAAGARTRWHQHTGTQILLCTAGAGWYQEQGEPARRLHAGDAVVIRPGVVHWHGAAKDCEFSHLSVIPNPDQNKDTWLEAVDETEYQNL